MGTPKCCNLQCAYDIPPAPNDAADAGAGICFVLDGSVIDDLGGILYAYTEGYC